MVLNCCLTDMSLTQSSKSFKTKWALVGHLKGPAHGSIVYACPACNRKFKSLTAMTAHCESNSTKCHMRHTREYGAYLDQLTGGIIDVDDDRHDDGTPRYHTSKSAQETYGGASKSEEQNLGAPPVTEGFW
jgi:palmitoyltransferase